MDNGKRSPFEPRQRLVHRIIRTGRPLLTPKSLIKSVMKGRSLQVNVDNGCPFELSKSNVYKFCVKLSNNSSLYKFNRLAV